MKVTLDTNAIPASRLIQAAEGLGADFVVTSVTEREMEDYHLRPGLPVIPETAVFGESRFGSCVLGGDDEPATLEDLLQIISNGSFPPKGGRDSLTDGQKRQLRDAMILHAHIREGRDIFISDDRRAFVGKETSNLRKKLEIRFGVRVMTCEEFLAYCQATRQV